MEFLEILWNLKKSLGILRNPQKSHAILEFSWNPWLQPAIATVTANYC